MPGINKQRAPLSRFPNQQLCRGRCEPALISCMGREWGEWGWLLPAGVLATKTEVFYEVLNLNSHPAAGMWAHPGHNRNQTTASELPAMDGGWHPTNKDPAKNRGWHPPKKDLSRYTGWPQTSEILSPEGTFPTHPFPAPVLNSHEILDCHCSKTHPSLGEISVFPSV